jgi:acetylornithine deacetylase
MDAPRSLDSIARLIAFDTTSRNANRALIDHARETLSGLGARIRLTTHPTGTKQNLFATVGSGERPGLLLSGHTDTVPVDGQAWAGDPFTLRRDGDRIVGRGVVDMKGFLAIVLAKLPEMAATAPEETFHVALSYDEEVGCLGVPLLIDDIRAAGIRPAACIVGEPTGMTAVVGQKGKIGCHVTVRGRAAHTGVPHLGVNAIEAAGRAIAHLAEVAAHHREHGPHDHGFEEPPYTTIQHGLVAGGIAVNTVPDFCTYDFDIRYLPGVDPRAIVDALRAYVALEIEPAMKRIDPDAGFTFTLDPGCLAFDTAPGQAIVRRVLAITGDSALRKVGFGTEAGHFAEAGIPTVVCGPGDISEAHRANESLSIADVVACERFLDALAAA